MYVLKTTQNINDNKITVKKYDLNTLLNIFKS